MSIRIPAYVFAAILSIGMAGCDNDRTAGDAIEDASDSAANGIENMGDKAKDAADDIEDKAKDATN